MSSHQPLINAFNSLRKRDGDYPALLKAIYFHLLKDKYPTKTIGEILLESRGGSWGNEKFEDGIKAKVLRSPDIRLGFIDFESAEERFFTEKEVANLNLRKDDILVIKSNGSLDLVGKSQIFKSNPEFPYVVASNFLLVLRPNHREVFPEYVDLFLKSPQALVWRFDEQKTTTGLRNLNTKGFLSLEIPVPDTIEEQERLYEDFRRYLNQDFHESEDYYKKLCTAANAKEDLINEFDQQLILVKELRKAYLREAIQGTLVPQNPDDEGASVLLETVKAEKAKLIADKKIKQGKIQEPETQDELLFRVPESWIWCALDEICIYITDGTHQTPTYTSTGKVFLSAQNVKPFRFMPKIHKHVSEEAYTEYVRNRRAEKGDLLVARVGAGIGETAVIDQEIDFCFYVSLGLVKPFKKYIWSDYLAVVFNSPYGIKYAKGNISSKGGSAGNFNLGRIRSFLIPLPPLNEQKRIVEKLDKLMAYCDELEANIRASKQYAETLLQVVLTEALEPNRYARAR
jgi:type I restriction enzyme, S subunit